MCVDCADHCLRVTTDEMNASPDATVNVSAQLRVVPKPSHLT